MSFNFDKFLKVFRKEAPKKMPAKKPYEGENPALEFRKRYAEKWQNRITWTTRK